MTFNKTARKLAEAGDALLSAEHRPDQLAADAALSAFFAKLQDCQAAQKVAAAGLKGMSPSHVPT